MWSQKILAVPGLYFSSLHPQPHNINFIPTGLRNEYGIVQITEEIVSLSIRYEIISDLDPTSCKRVSMYAIRYLLWDEQYITVRGKIYGGLASLKKLKDIYRQKKLCSVYYAIVESHLCYANEICGSHPKTKLNTLQRLQDRAQSIVENARYKDNWSCDWLSVEHTIRVDRSIMTHKIRNKLSPGSLWDEFQKDLRCQTM